jgi:hypothetical protein
VSRRVTHAVTDGLLDRRVRRQQGSSERAFEARVSSGIAGEPRAVAPEREEICEHVVGHIETIRPMRGPANAAAEQRRAALAQNVTTASV